MVAYAGRGGGGGRFNFIIFRSKGVEICIVQAPPNARFPSLDTIELQTEGLAKVRMLDVTRLAGGGIIHSKMWLVDGQHFYIGSAANLDWRALTQMIEV